MSETPLHRALTIAKTQSRLAEMIGTSQQNISNWLRDHRDLPAEYVLAAEKSTGISRHEWRPDIYPAPAKEGAQDGGHGSGISTENATLSAGKADNISPGAGVGEAA